MCLAAASSLQRVQAVYQPIALLFRGLLTLSKSTPPLQLLMCLSTGFVAMQGVLASLAGSSLESASAVNPALVRLQMVRTLAEAWQLRWPAVVQSPSNPSATETLVGFGVGAAPTIPSDGQWQQSERHWRAREAQSGALTHQDLLDLVPIL